MPCVFLSIPPFYHGIERNLAKKPDNISAFSAVFWPSVVLPVPQIWVGPTLLEDEIIQVWDGRDGKDLHPVDVPDELYLRGLMDLNLDDREAIRLFIERHGVVLVPDLLTVANVGDGLEFSGFAQLMEQVSLDETSASAWRKQYQSFYSDEVLPTIRAALNDAKRASEDGDSNRASELLDQAERIMAKGRIDDQQWCHLRSFQNGVKLVRDMARVRLALEGKIDFSEVQRKWESFPIRTDVKAAMGWPSEEQAVRILAAGLNQGLATLRANVSIVRRSDGAVIAEPPASQRPTLFGALCLQMANHIAENATFNRCAKCGRWFVHKEGRPYEKPKPNRRYRSTGVMYCSDPCAKAASQQKYYARQKKKGAKQ